MNSKSTATESLKLQSTVAGAGLVALDVVINLASKTNPQHYAGGTCGNVLTILSYLGWHALPISRLKNDQAAKWILSDLQKWGVDCSLVSLTKDGSTAVIVENIKTLGNGQKVHSFSLRCPCCGSYLPGYKSVLGSQVEEISPLIGEHQVFFFDRVSRGNLLLAEKSAAAGAVIVFEPSGIGEPRLFREAWSIAHIVKYSNERLRDIADLDLSANLRKSPLLEIETLGGDGLRYRSRLKNAVTRDWKLLKVISTRTVEDAAGAGDWCTAGLVHKLARRGLSNFERVTRSRLVEALRYGQALATWNCGFDGARGGMYCVKKPQFEKQIRNLLSGKAIHIPASEPAEGVESIHRLCPTCDFSSLPSEKKVRA